MKGKSLALLVLALGCGLVASLGITQVLAKRGDQSVPSDTAPVFVAKADIAGGSLVNDDNVKLEQWPKDRIPVGSVSRKEDIDGRRARQMILAGEPMIDRRLLARGQVPTDSMVPKGLRVVAIQVGPEAINGGLVLPGSRCDLQVFIRADHGMGVGETLCKTILQDIRVFAVNDITSTESQDPKAPDTKSIPLGKTVSLLVSPAQAQIVTLASQLGMIRLILRSGEDSEQPKTLAMTAHELIGAAGGSDRAKENPNEDNEKRFQKFADDIRKMLRENAKADPAGTPASEEPQRFTMRVRSGAEVNDVLLINNSGVQGLPGDEGAWTVTGMGASLHGKADSHGSKPAEAGPLALPTVPAAPSKSGTDSPLPPVKPGYKQPVGS